MSVCVCVCVCGCMATCVYVCIYVCIHVYYFQTVNDCHLDTCKNGGICEDKINGFVCHCVNGYTGQDCSTGEFLLSKCVTYLRPGSV